MKTKDMKKICCNCGYWKPTPHQNWGECEAIKLPLIINFNVVGEVESIETEGNFGCVFFEPNS